MKKIIAILGMMVLFGAFAADVVNAQTKDRVKIEVSGFDDNEQALLVITQFLRKESGDIWQLVQSDPEGILYISIRTERIKSWQEIDHKAVLKNSLKREGARIAQDLVYSLPGYNRVAYSLKNTAASSISRQVEYRQKPEIYDLEKWRSTATVTLVNAKTGKIISKEIGQNTITVRVLRRWEAEPQVLLVDGDLSEVGISAGENLDGAMRQLLQLSAYQKSNLPENAIVD